MVLVVLSKHSPQCYIRIGKCAEYAPYLDVHFTAFLIVLQTQKKMKKERRKKPELLLEFECICAAERGQRGQRGRGNAHTELDVVFAYSLLVLIRIVQRRLGLCTLTIYSVFICNEFMFEQWKLFGRVRACAVCGCFLPARNHIVDSCMEIFETKT